jgi:peptidoglycan hydrolase-like protein with peptidoglycan-binding domain
VLKGAEVDAFERKQAPVAPKLQRGSTGAAVRALQVKLVKAGFMTNAEVSTGPGVFGPRTEQAVLRFQESVDGLKPTGVAGPSTMDALGRHLSRKPPVGVAEREPVAEVVLAPLTRTLTDETAEETNPMGGDHV